MRDLDSGMDEWLAYPIQRDEQESRFTRDLLPAYSFTPDSQSVVVTKNGKLVRINISDKSIQPIAMDVPVKLDVVNRLEFPRTYRTHGHSSREF